MSPEAHDAVVAFTSHLPQMASTALASLLLDQLPASSSWRVAGGGLRDTTRLAASAYELWRDICLTNADNIDRALSAYIGKLENIRRNLRDHSLEEEFRRGGEFFSRLQKISQDFS
jgi:prephenate dehydrogenase